MLKRIIAWSVANKLIVLLFTAGAIAGGVWALSGARRSRRCPT